MEMNKVGNIEHVLCVGVKNAKNAGRSDIASL
jgi:hypothetical protein